MFNKKKRKNEEIQNNATESYDSIPGVADSTLRDENIGEQQSPSDEGEQQSPSDAETQQSAEDTPEVSELPADPSPDAEEDDGQKKGQGSGPELTVDALEEAYCLGAGIDPGSLAMAKEKLVEIAEAFSGGKFNPDLIHTAIKLLNHDKLVEEARNKGREEVKAERLADAFRHKRRKVEEAAAIPHFNGTKGLGAPLGSDSIFNLAREAKPGDKFQIENRK